MILFKRLIMIVSLLSVSYTQASTIYGVVTDKQTSLPIIGAKVDLVKEGLSTTTNSSGEFSLTSQVSPANLADTLRITNNKYWQKDLSITSLSSSHFDIKLQATKQRLVITTDIGGADPDDLQSLVHALVLANEYDLQGIIYGHAWVEANPKMAQQRIGTAVDAYEKVFTNLSAHASGYPSPDYLRAIVKGGQTEALMAGTGEGKDSEGSKLIIELVDNKDDPRPVWVNAWGGANTIAQAFWKIKHTRSPAAVKAFVNKIRVYDILGQDDAGSWIAKNFPDALYIRNAEGVYGWAPSKSWTADNVQNHGPLGEVYPTSKWATEGDSPSFFHIAARGLNEPDELTQGGWGGRFGAEKKYDVKLFSWAEKHAEVMAHEQKLRPYALYTNTEERTAAIKKWQPDIENSLAARMDWSVTPNPSKANHFPIAVLNGDVTRQILDMSVKTGEQLSLSANGSSDPDGNTLHYSWQFYDEASSYDGEVKILNGDSSVANVVVPADASGKNLHIILVVHDSGSPSLAAYRRMILNVN